jgi:hypothetical protein
MTRNWYLSKIQAIDKQIEGLQNKKANLNKLLEEYTIKSNRQSKKYHKEIRKES